MEKFKLSNQLSRHESITCNKVLSYYKKLGESVTTINKIQCEIKMLAKTHYTIDSILQDHQSLLQQVERTRKHKIIRITQHKNFKIAIHLIPSMFIIPAHLHTGLISTLYCLQGELLIEQESLSLSKKKHHCIIKKQQACTGLLNLRNIHQIHTLESPCIFLSFRISKKKPHADSLKRLLYFLVPTTLFLFPSILIYNKVTAEKKIFSTPNSLLDFHYENPILVSNNVELANKLRKGDTVTQDLYQASQLYLQAAIKGNAEAQYWLGVMYLEGSGITENTDDALEWISLSSDQTYPPAEKLLHHLLTTDEVLDC